MPGISITSITIKHGLVAEVCEWPYSTFHRFVRSGLYPRDWAGSAQVAAEGGESEFGEMIRVRTAHPT
jgi:hypothetical protein